MKTGYRFKAMDLWYRQPPGSLLLSMEQEQLEPILTGLNGDCLLQVGGPSGSRLHAASHIPFHCHLYPKETMLPNFCPAICSHLTELALSPASVDVALIVHMLEFIPHPFELLTQVSQALADNGQLIILGFNPWSFWGLKRHFSPVKGFPWQGNFISTWQLRQWLMQLNYQIHQVQTFCFRPPVEDSRRFKRLLFLEALGQSCLPGNGAVYMMVAQKFYQTVTPVRQHWWERKEALPSYAEPTTRESIR